MRVLLGCFSIMLLTQGPCWCTEVQSAEQQKQNVKERIATHLAAAEELEESAHQHRFAAKTLSEGSHERAAYHANKAAGHLVKAREQADQAAKLASDHSTIPDNSISPTEDKKTAVPSSSH